MELKKTCCTGRIALYAGDAAMAAYPRPQAGCCRYMVDAILPTSAK